MKRRIINLAVMLGIIASMLFTTPAQALVFSIPVLWEKINTGGDSNSSAIAASSWASQVFVANSTTPHTITSVRLQIARTLATGGYCGNVTVSVRETVAGLPTGADLGSAEVNGDNLSNDYSWVDFGFSSQVALAANVTYALVLRAPYASVGTYVTWKADAGGDGDANGYGAYSTDGGYSWASATPVDFLFEVWGYNSLRILDVAIFKNYISTNSTYPDWLICTEIESTCAPYYPYYDPTRYMKLQFISVVSGNTTVIAENRLVSWGRQPLSIYLKSDLAKYYEWGNTAKYRIRLADYTGAVYTDYPLVTASWKGADLWYLDQWVRLTANDLENYWGASYLIQLTNNQLVLNEAGGGVFNAGIAALSDVRPNLFQASVQRLTYTTGTWTKAGEAATTWEAQVGPEMTTMINGMAGVTGVSGQLIGASLIFLVFLVVAVASLIKGYAWAGLIVGTPILLFGMSLRFLTWQFMAVMGAVLILLMIREFWWKGA